MADFAGKVAFITGGGRGMARTHAAALARAGADVARHRTAARARRPDPRALQS